MMEEHKTCPSQDGDAANAVDCQTVVIKGRGNSMLVDGHCTDFTPYTSPGIEEERQWHDKGHPPHTLDYITVSVKEEPELCMEKRLTPENLLSQKERLPFTDKSTPTAQTHSTSDFVTEKLSEDDEIITVLIKDAPHSHDGQNVTIPNSHSTTDHPSAIQPNSASLLNEIEVVYQNPPNFTIGDIANLTRYSRTHSKRKTIQCLVCGKYFLRTSHLVAHEVTHSEKCTVSCSKCGQVFPSTADLLVHKKTHRPETLFLCLECGRCYRCRGQLVLHQRRHFREKSLTNT